MFLPEVQSVRIQAQGRLDGEGAVTLQQQLALIDQRCSLWILDLAQVTFMDSAGLVALTAAHKLAKQRNARLILCQPSSAVHLILEISQLDRVFEIAPKTTDLDRLSRTNEVPVTLQAA